MAALITASVIRTCFGDGQQTFTALLSGRCGVSLLRHYDTATLGVTSGYQILDDGVDDGEPLMRPSRWLAECVSDAIAQSRLRPAGLRIVAIVGTGLRELRAVERLALGSVPIPTEHLHFDAAVRRALPEVSRVITLSNACSAGGHALALAQDLLDLGEADAVVAAAADGMTESMLAMIGRFATAPTDRVRPFDRDRTGVLLGEGAAAVVVVPDGPSAHPLARLLATGLSCDAVHETVPKAEGILRSLDNAFTRAGRTPADVDLVIAHGTGTELNDPLEASLLQLFQGPTADRPVITGTKGAVGHTSGAAALISVDVAIRCLNARVVPSIVGLRRPLEGSDSLAFVVGHPMKSSMRLAQVNAFGFGGVNAVTLLEAA